MIALEELQRRIEKRLAESGFSQPELLIRRAHRMAQAGKDGSQAHAGQLLKDAGSTIGLHELSNIINHKPWLLEIIIEGTGKAGGRSDHH